MSRIVSKPTFDPVTALLAFVLILISTSVAVFMGLAFGLALFATIVFIKVFDVKLIVSYSLLAAIAFATVMVPWSQIKSEQAPVDAYDAVSMATFSASKTLNEFNPEKVFYEAFQTQLALLNIVGELPPSSGLMVANENRIFGAPVYGENDNCGRFLTGIDPDWLWGPIETIYDDRCVPQESLELISGINRVSQIFYPLVGLSLLFVLILSIGFQSNLRPIIFPAFLITLPYIVMSASISRYGALIIPLGAFLLLELITPKGLLSKSEIPVGTSKLHKSNEEGK
jgi:hypothetical protein